MADYTDPIEATFDLQRRSIEQSRVALERTLTLPTQVGEAALESLDSQERVQRDAVELQHEAVTSLLDAIDEMFPGAESSTAGVRDSVDGQYETLLENHAALFETLRERLDEGVDTYDDLSEESVETLDELVDSLADAQAELEEQSLEATEELEAQLADLRTQVEGLQEQVQGMVDEDDTEE